MSGHLDHGEPPERTVSDADALDRLQAMLNEASEWNGGDVCEALAQALEQTGRRIDP